MSVYLQPIKTSSLSSQVFETLRGAIFAGTYQPGEQLTELHLSQELQVSQNTVREALVQLERLGLVKRVPNKGTTVTRLSEEDIAERLAVRLTLEQMAFAEAAKRMDGAGFVELSKLIEAISQAQSGNAYYEMAHAGVGTA